jgi:hypothetical protein
MSVVTNIILTCSLGERTSDDEVAPPPIAALSAWLEAEGYGAINNLGERAGGYKHMECYVFGGAANYLPLDAFLSQVWAQAWHEPQYVQVFIQRQEDNLFTLYDAAHQLA